MFELLPRYCKYYITEAISLLWKSLCFYFTTQLTSLDTKCKSCRSVAANISDPLLYLHWGFWAWLKGQPEIWAVFTLNFVALPHCFSPSKITPLTFQWQWLSQICPMVLQGGLSVLVVMLCKLKPALSAKTGHMGNWPVHIIFSQLATPLRNQPACVCLCSFTDAFRFPPISHQIL